VTVWL